MAKVLITILDQSDKVLITILDQSDKVLITILDQGDEGETALVGVKVEFDPEVKDGVPVTAAQEMGLEMLRSMRHRVEGQVTEEAHGDD